MGPPPQDVWGTVREETENAPHSTRPKRLRDTAGNACVGRGDATDAPLCPFFREGPKNTCPDSVSRARLSWGRLHQPDKKPP